MAGSGRDDPVLLLALGALLAAVAATASVVAQRRARRAAGFLLGMLLGAVATLGLAGLGVVVFAGPEGLRRVLQAVEPPADWTGLPRVIRPGDTTGTPPGPDLVGMVTWVRDGDTIVVANRPIRLRGLNCEEAGTALGDRATAMMRRLVQGQRLACSLNGERTYDREVGRCTLPNGEDIGAMMIASRLCGRCARYDLWRDYAAVQAEAGPFAGVTPSYCWAPW